MEGVAIMEYVISAIWSALELLCVALFNGAFLVKKPRKKSESQIYHIILRGNNRQDIFYNDTDRLFMLSRIEK